MTITRTPETVSGQAQGRFGDYNRPESLAEAYAVLDRLLISTTIDLEPGERGAQKVAAIDAAREGGRQAIALALAERGAQVIATDPKPPHETVLKIGRTDTRLNLVSRKEETVAFGSRQNPGFG